jgi:hypothetical protein
MITKHHANAFAERSGFRLASWRECSHYDTNFFHRMAQHLRQWVYAFRHRHPGSAVAMDRLPVVRKSATWKIPPPYSASRDHAVVFFERP